MFGRKNRSRRHGASAPSETDETREDTGTASTAEAAETTETTATTETAETTQTVEGNDAEDPRAHGPHDESELEGERDGYLDLGCILLPPIPGLNVRLEIDESAQLPRALNLDFSDGSVQVQAFAAPKSTGLWDEVRRELVASLRQEGGEPTVSRGPLGLEVAAKFPATTADGQPGYRLARFVGVDGPRWFVRAVFTGQAALPTDTARALEEVVRSLVIVRGSAPMPPRDLLPFTVPENAVRSDTGQRAGDDAAAAGSGNGRGSAVPPPRRGPEITEIG